MAALSGGKIDSLDNISGNKKTEKIQSSKNSSNEKKGTSIYENILNDIEKESEVKKGSRCCYKIYNRVDKNL